VTGAARLLGVHANTVRAWTEQGRLPCLRINDRGDRRYRVADLRAFLDVAGVHLAPARPFTSRLRLPAADWRDLGVPGTPPPDRLLSEPDSTRMLAEQPVLVLGAAGGATRSGGTRRSGSTSGAAPRGAAAHGAAPRGAAAHGTAAHDTAPRGTASHGTPAHRDDAASDLAAVARLFHGHQQSRDLDEAIREASRALLDTGRFGMVAVAEWRDGRFAPRLVDGARRARSWWQCVDLGLASVCVREGRAIATPSNHPLRRGAASDGVSTVTVFVPVRSGTVGWGVVVAESAGDRSLGRSDIDLLTTASVYLELMVERARLAQRVVDQRAQARALARMSTDLSSRLEFPVIMSSLVDHSIELFHADRAAVWRSVAGRLVLEFSRNLSDDYVERLSGHPPRALAAMAVKSGSAVAANDVTTDPRLGELREVMRREGFGSVALAPLVADGETLGLVTLYHDQHHEWNADDLQVFEGLATQAAVAVRNARNFQQTTNWAAQLQSIQQLGTRLDRHTTVTEIGHGICAELRQLIEYHNVRVYRVRGDDVEPIAWRGEIGEYTQEDGEQLRLKVGQGITGWVAEHGVSQYLPDAGTDERSSIIPGTEPDLAESMLLAPMLYEDKVIGVIVLSKLGLDQFTTDDLRYLEIYASMAAQAMVKADATEQLRAQSDRLARQLATQRELMRVTESILSTLDPRVVVEEIADRLGGMLRVDNVAIAVYDADAGLLRPLTARGVDADEYLATPLPDSEGLSGWVARRGEAQLVQNALGDPRVAALGGVPHAGALIVAPLRARDRVTGVLLVERIGPDASFEEDEFELIQLFAGHVSIALQNALAHQAVEIRAQTDALTGLKNQGTFQEYIEVAVQRGAPFSLLIVDLDQFKAFNDRCGHEAGNVLLQEIGHALRAACRDSDEVFRYGGDEFAIILPNTDVPGAMEVAGKVGRAVRGAPGPSSRRPAGVTCSIGVAGFPLDAADRPSLVLAADRACYVAKRNGRNHSVTAAEGLALAGDMMPEPPTPVDDPTTERSAA